VNAYDVCPLCDREIDPGVGAAAFRGRIAHLACWLEWREGRRSSPRPSILVVDDDEAGRYATCRILEKANFSVVEAPDGSSALTAVADRPDLVLLDLQLPDVDGFEVCRRIKSAPATASIRVLPFTAVFKNDADRRRAFEAGADGFLIRPIPAGELVATVNGLIGVG
jgi:CheY-like chemotaxis protein